jgi:hypothetical protein
MTPTHSLCKINILDSTTLDDVKFYMTPTLLPNHNLNYVREYKYFGLEEEKFESHFEPFTYKINQYGFREERVDQEIDTGAFGCSFTFGQGLPSNSLWHQIIAEKCNQKIFNFGVPGCSAQSILEIFCIVSKHIKMRNALILLPSYNRMQIAKINPSNRISLLTCIPSHSSIFNKDCGLVESDVYKVLPDEEFIKDIKNSIYIAEHIAKLRNINLSVSTWDKDTYGILEKMRFSNIQLMPQWSSAPELVKDRARDGRHPGLEHHKVHALKFLPFVK